MYNFLDKQIATLEDDKATVEEKLNAYEKANNKLTKIMDIITDNYDTEEITYDNLDETMREMRDKLENIDDENMKTNDLIDMMEIKDKIEKCKKMISKDRIVKIFISKKNGNIEEITEKIKDGLFIEQISE